MLFKHPLTEPSRDGSGCQSNTTWDWEPNSCGRSRGPHESSSHKSRPPITRHAPPLDHASDSGHHPPKPREEAQAGRGAGAAVVAFSLHRDNHRRRPGGRPPIRAMEKVSARGHEPQGVSACCCAMSFSAPGLFVTTPARLGVKELAPI